jgi:hypothetical protein
MWRPQPLPPVQSRIAHPGVELPAGSELVAVGRGGQQRCDGDVAQTVRAHHGC